MVLSPVSVGANLEILAMFSFSYYCRYSFIIPVVSEADSFAGVAVVHIAVASLGTEYIFICKCCLHLLIMYLQIFN